MTATSKPGLAHISRSLLPWVLARMAARPGGNAIELPPESLVDWALAHTARARPLLELPP